MDEEIEQYEENFEYLIDKVDIRQGAEARIYNCTFLGKPAVLKERFSKKYRHETLDIHLNHSRLKQELKCMNKAQQLGVETPAIYFVDSIKNHIIMNRIEGITAKESIENKRLSSSKQEFENYLIQLGEQMGLSIGKLHAGSLIHGDLTTSNILLKNESIDHLVFIDFGLSQQGQITSEEKGVDLYVLERAINSTHRDSEKLFEGIWEGYKKSNPKKWESQLAKLEEIRQRGRKRDMVG